MREHISNTYIRQGNPSGLHSHHQRLAVLVRLDIMNGKYFWVGLIALNKSKTENRSKHMLFPSAIAEGRIEVALDINYCTLDLQ